MRHKKARYPLNRFTSWRKATIRSLVRSVLLYQSIRTTRARARAAQPLIDKLIALARRDTLNARREAFRVLQDHRLVSALFSDIAKRFADRSSGYTRIIHTGNRRGDDARLVLLELTEIKKKEKPVKKQKEAETPKDEAAPEKPAQEKKPKTATALQEKPSAPRKEQPKKFLGGLRSIFKKERDSL